MYPRLVPILVAIAAGALAACGSAVDSAVFMSAPPVPSGAEVRIYQTQTPACAYDELGIVTWRPKNPWQKLQKGVGQMRERAAEMGGHAIVGFSIGERTHGTTTTISSDSANVTASSSVDTQTVVSGTVIRFREGSCAR